MADQWRRIGPAIIERAEVYDLTCDENGRNYRIWVSPPAQPAPPEGWPLFLTTDGESYFGTLAAHAAIRSLGDLTPTLVVAIGYPDASIGESLAIRNTDLTPPTPHEALPEFLRPAPGLDFGGSDVFQRFLIGQVLPAIEAAFPVSRSHRTLFGHSLGGLFALWTMLVEPEAFPAYVASSPSLWWGDKMIFQHLRAFADRAGGLSAPPRILICAGALETHGELPEGLPPEAAAKINGMFAMAQMVANAKAMAAQLRAILPPQNVAIRIVPEEGHIGVIPAALAKALTFAAGPRSRFAAQD